MTISSTYIALVRQDLGVQTSLGNTVPVGIFTYGRVFSHFRKLATSSVQSSWIRYVKFQLPAPGLNTAKDTAGQL